MAEERAVLWRRYDGDGAEWCRVSVDGTRLDARGVQLGTDPVPYRCDYTVETEPDGGTRALHLHAEGAGWTRTLSLHRHAGRWDGTFATHGEPTVRLDQPCGDLGPLAAAADVDIEASPFTNTLPVRRLGLLAASPGTAHDLLVLWVAVPSLAVVAARQTYTAAGPASVGYASDGFRARIAVDVDGLVEDYPGLARRV